MEFRHDFKTSINALMCKKCIKLIIINIKIYMCMYFVTFAPFALKTIVQLRCQISIICFLYELLVNLASVRFKQILTGGEHENIRGTRGNILLLACRLSNLHDE